MITIGDIVNELGLTVFSGADKMQKALEGAYASDLLSDVMGRACRGNVWITMQTHRNIVAVASLKELAAILLVNGGIPEEETIETAEKEGIVLLGTREGSFATCGRLYIRMQKNALV